MLALLQRVSSASVAINQSTVASIDKGLLILCGFKAEDTLSHCLSLFEKCFKYRIFADDADKMNLSLRDICAQALIVPQFTLVADTKRGLRPSFSKGMPPELGATLFGKLVDNLPGIYKNVSFGQFGEDMKITLCNDGPVTFLLEN